jgi:signal transduction histidine kinase
MIDTLIDNMFHATLEELQILKVEPKEELSDIIEPMFKELQYYGTIHMLNKVPECLIIADKLRLNQAIDNIINNSYKYAGTPIEVSFEEENKSGIKIIIKDKGLGVSSEELPMVMEKYYRGNNSKGKNGSGLGLYLAKSFLECMYGGMECYNDNGFTVVLFLKKV